MRVLLFRDSASTTDDSWESTLASRGHASVSVGVVTTAPRDARALSEALARRPPPWAIALTSRHAAAALSGALAAAPADARRARLFCVGARTAEPLGDAASRVEGTAAGNAGALAALIVAAAAVDVAATDGAETRRVLFVCGAQRLDTLPSALRDARVDVTEIAVYDTEPVPPDALAASLERAGGVRSFAALVVFSPSGFAAARAGGAFLRSDGAREQPRLVAIGPSTAAAMAAAGLPAVVVAAAPNADAVADALDTLV
jgi:uroporphyrinogen-III synthase